MKVQTVTKTQLLEALEHVSDDAEILISVGLQEIGLALAAVTPKGKGGNPEFIHFALNRSLIYSQNKHYLVGQNIVVASDDQEKSQFEEQWSDRRDPDTKVAVNLIELRIVAKDWQALSLPSPAELLKALKNGERREVSGHRLSPDEDGVWVTNSYGVDCGLWQELSLEIVEEFLIDMARGQEYGPTPN